MTDLPRTKTKTSFANYVTIFVVLVHLFLLPALFLGMGYVIRKSHEDLFTEHARTFARVIAEEFEAGAALDSHQRTEDLLDLAILHGDARYAEIFDRGVSIRDRLGSPDIVAPRHTDLTFGQGGDHIYFIVLPIVQAGHNAELRLGFDEAPAEDRIHLALNRMLWLLGGYLGLAIGIAIVLSYRLSRPIRRLQDVSRAIARGDYGQVLNVSTGIRELHDLAVDLEAMRGELVGVNDRLQAKIKEKEQSEMRREELQRQLRHRQRLETVGTLASGIAHEINNVLVPIILFTSAVLKEAALQGSSRTNLERVLAAARRAKDVVKKILTFTRQLDTARLTPIDLRVVIGEGLNLFSALAPPRIEIRTDIEEVPMVQGDATLALHLIINLCTNAYQAMEGVDGILTIGLRRAERRTLAVELQQGVELSVSDTGHGMDQDTVERMFEPFFTTRSVGQGTGLGLAVVHGIVESFGATITVETEVGAGAVFRIFFPLVLAVEGPRDLRTAKA
ncbi:MAG TPA: ATP-binding protein [Steroidobacteraceae bacterium]|jgi:signal transduction histidine kinase